MKIDNWYARTATESLLSKESNLTKFVSSIMLLFIIRYKNIVFLFFSHLQLMKGVKS